MYNSIRDTRRMFQYQVIVENGMIDTTALDFRPTPCHCSVNQITCTNNFDCTNMQAETQNLNWSRKALG